MENTDASDREQEQSVPQKAPETQADPAGGNGGDEEFPSVNVPPGQPVRGPEVEPDVGDIDNPGDTPAEVPPEMPQQPG